MVNAGSAFETKSHFEKWGLTSRHCILYPRTILSFVRAVEHLYAPIPWHPRFPGAGF
jgi:hypothetical protein